MNDLFGIIEFTEENEIKLSQVNKDNYIKYRKKHMVKKVMSPMKRYDNYRKLKRMYKKKRITITRLIMLKNRGINNQLLRLMSGTGNINLVNFLILEGANWWNQVLNPCYTLLDKSLN